MTDIILLLRLTGKRRFGSPEITAL